MELSQTPSNETPMTRYFLPLSTALILASACHGYYPKPPAMGETHSFVSIVAGSYHVCGLQEDGQAQCWSPAYRMRPPKGVRFRELVAAGGYTCGIRVDSGEAHCWGTQREIKNVPKGVRFLALSPSLLFVCGIRAVDHGIECWGQHPPQPAPGKFSEVYATQYSMCGKMKNRRFVQCWGPPWRSIGEPILNMDLLSITFGLEGPACAITSNERKVICWNLLENLAPDVELTSLFIADGNFACGLDTSAHAHCWGLTGTPIETPKHAFVTLALASHFACGIIKDTGKVECWGYALESSRDETLNGWLHISEASSQQSLP